MFRNRVRLPFYLSRAQFPVERNVFRKADGSSKLLSSIIRHTYEGETDQLPEDWHRKLVIALSHDEVTIEDNRLLTEVVLDGDYSIDWQRFLNYPLAKSEFKIQVTPFNATNSNCQSCAEITQLSLVDDTTDAIWGQGTTNIFPFDILLNDTICCYPFIVEIVSFNDTYFDSVVYTDAGTVVAQVKDSVPTINNVLVAMYRVTCENGGYDEANIYANISGDAEECLPPSNLSIDATTTTEATLSWDAAAVVPAGGYDWAIYEDSDLITPVQSGNTSSLSVIITGLTPDVPYTFTVRSNCGGGSLSTPISTSFASRLVGITCGNFSVTYVPTTSTGLQSYSYIDCNGDVQTSYFSNFAEQEKCMLLQSGTETPVFFTATTTDINITYIEEC